MSVCDSDNGPVPTGRNGYVVVTAGPGYEVRRTRPEELGPLPAGGSRPPCPISSADKAHRNVYRWALSLGRSRCRPAMGPYMSSMRALAASRRSCYAAHDVAGLGCHGLRLQRAHQARSSGPDGSSGRDGHVTARQRLRPVAAWTAEQGLLPALGGHRPRRPSRGLAWSCRHSAARKEYVDDGSSVPRGTVSTGRNSGGPSSGARRFPTRRVRDARSFSATEKLPLRKECSARLVPAASAADGLLAPDRRRQGARPRRRRR